MLDQSLLAAAPSDALQRARADEEAPHLAEATGGLAARTVVLARLPEPPVGAAAHRALTYEQQ